MAEYIERTSELLLAANAGARAIENEKRYYGAIYIRDAFGPNKSEIAYLKAAKVLRGVEEAPAADVAPVVHAMWGTGRFNLETGHYEEQCTRCRNFSKEYGKPYCPNCGAKMDGVV